MKRNIHIKVEFKKYIKIPRLVFLSLAVTLGPTQLWAKKKVKVSTSQVQIQSDLSLKFEKLRSKLGIPLDQVGMIVLGDQNQSLLQVNSDRLFIPASISKIPTAATVLNYFPPGVKFPTQLLSDAKVENNILRGNLYFKGGGDPSFVSENLWFLVNTFKRKNIDKIEGDIIVDDSVFDSVRFDESRQEERVDRAYDAPVSGLSFNWNTANIFILPGQVGHEALVFIDPENEYLALENKTKTVSGTKNSISAERTVVSGKEVIVVSGQIGENNSEHVIYKSITKPDLWAGYQLKSFLSQRGIKITGQIRTGSTPDKAKVLAESMSKPIEQIVADMNKFSNNYVAEMLTKLVASSVKKPASLQDGTQIITEYLKKIGLKAEEFHFENPSGLTRKNKFSPAAMAKVLTQIKGDYRLFPEFVVSLPIAGIDGTLKKRMKNSEAERRVRAKTGLLTGVVALAGFYGAIDGEIFTFVFIYNGPRNEGEVRSFFDQTLELLVEYKND